MNEDEKSMYICKGFRILLIHMLEDNASNVELTFGFGNIKAKFNVKVIELE